jgi:hypothetical protein
VRVTRSGVLIARRFSGVDMMISVPLPAYKGVALDVVAGDDGAPRYRLSLAHRDRDLDVLLAETQDSCDAAADWKFWSSWLGLPRIEAADGQGAEGEARPTFRARRGNAVVRSRRPRFLMRRKGGDSARMTTVFAGEREIVCYE